MEKIYEEEEIEYWLQKGQIREYFDTPDLAFHLCRYEKGEYLTIPDAPVEDLLFVVRGTIQIYGIREDGSISPVNQGSSPTLIGDIEFSRHGNPPFFASAKTEVTCIALSMKKYQKQLDCDLRFLHMLLKSYGDKLELFTAIDIPASTTEERVLLYMKNICPSHKLDNLEAAIYQLHCSRRQLQRVLKKLCSAGQIEKTGRGRYRLKDVSFL